MCAGNLKWCLTLTHALLNTTIIFVNAICIATTDPNIAHWTESEDGQVPLRTKCFPVVQKTPPSKSEFFRNSRVETLKNLVRPIC